MRKRPRTTSAFTLLEMILVLVLIAIICTVMAPTFTQFASGRNNYNMATQVVSLAGYAHSQAISEGRVYRLNFDTSARSVWLTMQPESGAIFVAPPNESGQRYAAADTVTFKLDVPTHNDGSYVEFQPTGRTESARVWFSNSAGDTVEVACASATESFRIVPAGEMTR